MFSTALDAARRRGMEAEREGRHADRIAALLEEARLLGEIGDFDAARERAADALEIAATRDLPEAAAAANLVRARVELSAGQLQKARTYLERVSDRAADLRAELMLGGGDAEGALSTAESPVLRAEALAALGRGAEALAVLDAAKPDDPEQQWRAKAVRATATDGDESRRWLREAADQIQKAAAAMPTAMAALYVESPSRRAVLDRAAGFPEMRGDELARLRRVLGVVRKMNVEPDAARLLAELLDVMIEVAGATRGMIILRRTGARSVEVGRHASRRALTADEIGFSRTILDEAMKQDRPILSDDARASVRFRPVDSVRQKELRSVLCVPLSTSRGNIGGVYLDNRDQAGAFTAANLDLVRLLTDQTAIAMERSDQLRQRDARITALESRVMELEQRSEYGALVGRSERMQEVYGTIDKIASVDYPVIVEGETGTGKELLAREIHKRSRRAGGAFVPVNCGALAETLLESELFGHVRGAFTGADRDKDGLFATAAGGTLFLDEIEEMSEGMQKKLLRVLEDGRARPVGGTKEIPLDARVIAASNRSLKELVKENAFRSDLYYRLKAFSVTMPPLRERAEDIPLLVEHILVQIAAETGLARKAIDAEAVTLLMKAPWPGNVRELKNELRRMVVVSGERVTAADVPVNVRDYQNISTGLIVPGKYQEKMSAYEKQLILTAMAQNEGKIRSAARALGIDRNTLKAKLKKYGLVAADDSGD